MDAGGTGREVGDGEEERGAWRGSPFSSKRLLSLRGLRGGGCCCCSAAVIDWYDTP